ncbi:uncharacterized protein LW93_14017 [Fusarium fujikuroi]|nr:uncharacterized protein LW93_14017 [Fusarium fujikuroi]
MSNFNISTTRAQRAIQRPGGRRRRVRQDYESRHAELMAEYMAAKQTGDGAAMARVELLVMENSMTTMERNFEIGMHCQEEDVMWWEMI